jgi:hypothetical protein
VHGGALWTVLRSPGRVGGRGGAPQVRATGLTGLDHFSFTGRGDEILAAVNGPNKVVRIRSDGSTSTVLDATDRLQNPTSVAVRGSDVYVLSASYSTATDPNLLLAHLRR